MPRELVHWYVLDESLKDCPESIGKIISKNKDTAYLGAIAHDASYFYKFGSSPLVKVGKYLHGGYGNDTFIPLNQLLESCQSDKQMAFVFGMYSHAIVDQTFHPAIYYLTGDYYDKDKAKRAKARTAHRLFEVYLDSWLRKNKKYWKTPKLFKEISTGSDVLSKLTLPREIVEVEGYELGLALKYLVTIRKILINSIAGLSIRGVNHLFRNSLDSFDCLFAFGRDEPPEVFNQTLDYKNPVTGEEYSHSVEELLQHATDRLMALWPKLAGGELDLPGVSLNFDLPNTQSSDAQYFSEEAFFGN